MPDNPAFISAIAAGVIVIASAIWAEYRFRDFDKLPAHFGPTLKPTWYAPRFVMVWVVPASLIGVLGFVSWLVWTLPRDQINGDPVTGIVIGSAAIVASQGLILWLLTRWARQQG